MTNAERESADTRTESVRDDLRHAVSGLRALGATLPVDVQDRQCRERADRIEAVIDMLVVLHPAIVDDLREMAELLADCGYGEHADRLEAFATGGTSGDN